MENRSNFKFGERLEYFKPNFDERDKMFELHFKFFQNTLTLYWEKLKKYVEYDNLETTLAKYNINDYNHLWDLCRRDNVILKPDEEDIEFDDVFKAFSNEQLKILFESQNLRKVVQYFKWYKKNKPFKKVLPKNDPFDDEKYGLYYNERVCMSMRNKTYQMNLEDGKTRNDKEIKELKNAIEATSYVYFILKNPKEIPELTDMVVNHLQFMSPDDLTKLLKMIDKKFEVNNVGRPTFNWKIIKYDMKGNIVEEYNSRAECMEKNGIKKSLMSELISGKGKHKTYKSYKYIEVKYS